MTLTATTSTPLSPPRFFGDAVLGMTLVTMGLLAEYMAVTTPYVSALVPGSSAGSLGIGLGVWGFTLIAGGALLLAGTSHLARLLALVRRRTERGGPAARMLASASNEISVASGVVAGDGPAIPELVIGAFGAAVVHTLPPSRLIRRGARWETRTSDGWIPMEDPLEAASRDADRVRRWLSVADLDFVVRVYAAVVVDGGTIQRSAFCATITPEQIPSWVAALPRQRTLTKGRRDRLLALAQTAGLHERTRRRSDW